MCFKKLRRLKNLDKFEPEDFEQGPLQRIRSERENRNLPAVDDSFYESDWSYEGETSAGTGTTILKDYDEPGKAKCSECGYIRNTPHEIYLLPLDNGKHKFVCIYCYKEEESN